MTGPTPNPCREECKLSAFGLNHPSPRLFVTLQFGKPWMYLAWTSFLALYHLVWIILEIYWAASAEPTEAALAFIYLTNQSYYLLVATQWLDFLMTIVVFTTKTQIYDDSYKEMPLMFKVVWVLTNVSWTAAILVVLAYWILLSGSWTASSINKHLMNGILVLISLIICAKPVRILHFYQPLIFSVYYAIFTVIYYASGGGSIYTILNWDNVGKSLTLTLLLALVATPLIHLLCFGACFLRTFLYQKFYKGSNNSQKINPVTVTSLHFQPV